MSYKLMMFLIVLFVVPFTIYGQSWNLPEGKGCIKISRKSLSLWNLF